MKTTAIAIAATATLLIGCHTITEDLPPATSAPTGPTLVLPVVVTPVANPVPSNPGRRASGTPLALHHSVCLSPEV